MIRRNVKFRAYLVDDLLDLTRIARGTFDVMREDVDLRRIVHEALDICDTDLRAKRQVLQVSLDADRHGTVGDGARLQQVIWNLLKNASQFNARRRLHLRAQPQPARPPVHQRGGQRRRHRTDHAEQIVLAFTQAGDWVAFENGGLGRGPAISKATVEAHGGTLAASSPGPRPWVDLRGRTAPGAAR